MELLETTTVICSENESPESPHTSGGCTTKCSHVCNKNRQDIAAQAIGSSKTTLPSQNQPLESSELECSLCFRLYCKPVSTPCGHTYCKSCILAAMKYSPLCPLCRAKLEPPSKQKYSVNIVILNLVEKHFKEEYDQREKEEEEEGEQDSNFTSEDKAISELEDYYTRWSNCLLPSVRETCSVLLSCT